MKKLLLGIFIGLSLNQVANALDIQITPISTRDLLAGSALAGLLSVCGTPALDVKERCNLAWTYADEMMKHKR